MKRHPYGFRHVIEAQNARDSFEPLKSADRSAIHAALNGKMLLREAKLLPRRLHLSCKGLKKVLGILTGHLASVSGLNACEYVLIASC